MQVAKRGKGKRKRVDNMDTSATFWEGGVRLAGVEKLIVLDGGLLEMVVVEMVVSQEIKRIFQRVSEIIDED